MSDETVVTGDSDAKPADGGGDKPADKPAGDSPAGDKPAGDKPAGDKPAEKIIYGDDKAPEGGDKPSDKADDKKADKSDEAIKPVEVKDLKVPKDSNISEAQVEKIAELSTKHKLSTEAAQEILNTQADAQDDARDDVLASIESQHEESIKTWVKDVKSDTELGGAKFNETSEYAQRAVKKFGSEKFIEILNETGYGNHPEVVRAFARIGRAMSDDKLITGSPAKQSKSLEDIIYDKTNRS